MTTPTPPGPPASTLSITEKQVLSAVRTVLLNMLPAGIEVIRGQANRVPEPAGPSFVIMTPIGRRRLAYNTDTYSDGALLTPPQASVKFVQTPIELRIQLDVHGPEAGPQAGQAGDLAQTIANLWLDDYACLALAPIAQPLYATDPPQSPFIDGEQQYEERYSFDLALQYNPVLTLTQQFAAVIKTNAIYPVDLVDVA